MPLVKQGEALEADGNDLEGALSLYQQAMDGFSAERVPRPKLKEKIDSVAEKIVGRRSIEAAAHGAESARESAVVDLSVEIDASLEMD